MAKGGSNQALSADEVADILGVSVDTLYRQWRNWNLQAFYVGRQWRCLQRNLDAYIKAQQDKAA